MNKLFNIGDIIDGFCNGYFGRDDYERKICIMVNNKFAVFQYCNGKRKGDGVVLNNPEELSKSLVNEWKVL